MPIPTNSFIGRSTSTDAKCYGHACVCGFVQVPISEASNEGLPASGISTTIGVRSPRTLSLAQDTLERHYNSSFMAAGDAQRVWFPEMIERLRSQWRQGMSCDSLIGLRDDMDAMLQRIRSDRHIRPAIFRCPECGHIGEGAEPHVSVRAMILSLTRFGIAPAELTRPP
jgi:hypothetical protein